MPFEPLSPEELERFKPPCNDPQHTPGMLMMVIYHPMKWVCPSCGHATILLPNTPTCGTGSLTITGEPGVWSGPCDSASFTCEGY